MSKSLGILLRNLRKIQGINQKELSRGICSLSTLSRFESGEREPSKIVFDALISKLGKNSNKWEIILSENDKLLIKCRNYIDYLIKSEKWLHLEKAIKDYEKLIKIDNNLNEQYICLINAIIYNKNREYKKAIKECIKGLELTGIKINLEKFKINLVILENELKLICLLLEILLEENLINILDIYNYWKEVINYIDEKCTDDEYKLNFYIMSFYNIAYILYLNNKYDESLLYVDKGIKCIINNKSIYYLKNFLLLLVNLNDYISYELFSISKNIKYKDIGVILETIEQWSLKNFEEKEVYIRPYNSVYSINEVIRNTRNYSNKTQEELMLSKDMKSFIGNQYNISNIENCKQTPNKKSSKNFLQALDIGNEEESYRLSIIEDNFELQELGYKIDFYISIYNYEEALLLLNDLESKINMSNIYNKQYIEKLRLFIKNGINALPCEEYKNEIIKILSITIKDIDKLKTEKWERFFTKEELRLLLNIGGAYHRGKNYEEALIWYKKLEEYFEKFYTSSGIIVYRTLMYSLSQIYGLLGFYEKSIEKSKNCIFMDILNTKIYDFNRALFNIGWCYAKIMLKDNNNLKSIYKENCYKILKQSYHLSKLYNDNIVIDEINKLITLWNLE